MTTSDYVWVPRYQVASHLRNRPGLLLDRLSPDGTVGYYERVAHVQTFRDERNPTYRMKTILYDAAIEDTLRLDQSVDRTRIALVDAFVDDAFGPTMMPLDIVGHRSRSPERRRLFGRHGTNLFVAMASETRSRYWFWVKMYAIPVLQNGYVLFGCMDSFEYFLIPWSVLKPFVLHSPISSKAGKAIHYSFHYVPDRSVIQFRAGLELSIDQYRHQLENVTAQPPVARANAANQPQSNAVMLMDSNT